MSVITKLQILKLYKDLLRYGQNLKLTDKDYFCKRIRGEFRKNRDLTEQSAINFNFEVRFNFHNLTCKNKKICVYVSERNCFIS